MSATLLGICLTCAVAFGCCVGTLTKRRAKSAPVAQPIDPFQWAKDAFPAGTQFVYLGVSCVALEFIEPDIAPDYYEEGGLVFDYVDSLQKIHSRTVPPNELRGFLEAVTLESHR